MDSEANRRDCVKVVVRCRPRNTREVEARQREVVTVHPSRASIVVVNPAKKDEQPKTFTFDATYDSSSSQKNLYDQTASSIVENVLEGYNGTVFAYGQTGTGKTHTMEGIDEPKELRGITPNAFQHIFDKIALTSNKKFLVRASFLEIYNEDIRDLLGKDQKQRLELKEHPSNGVYVKDLTSYVLKTIGEIEYVLSVGKKNRTVGATLMNQESSRSHSIFTITIETAENLSDGLEHFRVGKLNLVDLAGSERQMKTGATGDRLKEATKINLSLSALGNVISALVDSKSSHVPYRDSKLTRILQDSLGGNTKTVMIATIGPACVNYDETIGTLRYANRAKKIKNTPRINEDPKDAMLREFQEEIERLRMQLSQTSGQTGTAASPQTPTDGERIRLQTDMTAAEEERRMALLELDRERGERVELVQKLSALKEQLLHGGDLLDKTKKQEALLREKERELIMRQQKEAEMKRDLEEKHQAHIDLDERYATLHEEVESKTKKLKKLFIRHQEARTEIKDLEEEFQQEREEYLDTIRNLERQLKLKNAIIRGFIPEEYITKIQERAVWDDEHEQWRMSHASLTGNKMSVTRPIADGSFKRRVPLSTKTAQAMDTKSARYRADNVLTLDLDLPERNTLEYTPPSEKNTLPSPVRGNGTLGESHALPVGPDMTIAAAKNHPTLFYSYGPSKEDLYQESKSPRGKRKTMKEAAKMAWIQSVAFTHPQNECPDKEERNFPKSRGLVPPYKRV